MVHLWRQSVAGRLLVLVGLATVLPLIVLVVAVLSSGYQTTASQTYATYQEMSRRYAAEFSARLDQKLGLLQALVALGRPSTTNWHELDPDVQTVWSYRVGDAALPPARQALLETVRLARTEILTAPEWGNYVATLASPIFDHGEVVGVVAIEFTLAFFQAVVEGVHVLKTGYALLVSHEGYRIAHPRRDLVGVLVGNDVGADEATRMRSEVAAGREFWIEKRALLTGKWSRQYYAPVHVGRSPAPWFFVVVVPVDEATAPMNGVFLWLLVGTLATLGLVSLTTWRVTQVLVRPLVQVASTADAIANGQFDLRVSWSSQDEIGHLAQTFNRMTDALVQTLRDQEEMVRRRTASLVDYEKMALLGRLTATIAHEINTPLGAIRSSATFLKQQFGDLAPDLSQALRALSDDDVNVYRHALSLKGVDLGVRNASDDRRRKRALVQRLAAVGVGPEVADDILFLARPEDEEALVLAAAQGHVGALHWATRTAEWLQSSSIILEAADRAAATVSALVDYVHVDDHEGQILSPAKELDTLLALYYGVAKRGVHIVREYEPEVVVWGDRDRLNQVWVNLINNAFQAMNYEGTLTLSVRRASSRVEVSFANDGPAIPAEWREKIFDPFFTTKKAGEGTGLGLDICRRIVEAHQGTLVLSEDRGLTVFTVSLPEPDSAPRSSS